MFQNQWNYLVAVVRFPGNGGCWCCCRCCCFLAAVRLFVDDSMVAGNVAVKNSCWCMVESENAGWTRGSWGLKTRNRHVDSE